MKKGPSKDQMRGDEFEGRDLLRALIDTLPDQFYIKDTEGRYLFNNTGHAKVLGVASPEEAAGKTVFDFYPKELAERYRADEQEIFRSGRPLVSKEEPSMDQEGNRRWHSTTKVPLRDGSKKIVGLVGMSRDITEHKEAEEALRRSRVRFQAVFENAAIGIGLVDMEGRFTESNPALQEMLGYSSEELLRMRWIEVTHPDDVGPDMSDFERLAAGELDSYQLEKRYVRKDGRVIWGHLTGSLIRSAEGEPQFTIGMVEDITERKLAEEALKESEKRFRSLIQNASDVITILEADATIRYESPAVERVLGYRPEERIGKNAFDYFHPDDRDQAEDTYAQALNNPGQVQRPLEFRLRHKDGSWRRVETTRTNLLDDPAVKGVVANSRDITERRRAEEKLRESEANYRTLVEDMPELVCQFSPDTTLTYVNEAYCRYFGKDREKLIGHRYLPFISKEYHEPLKKHLASLSRENPVGTFESQARRPDGEIRWQQWINRAVYDEEGNFVEYHGVGRDLNARELAEEALLESEERYRSLADASLEGIAISEDGEILDANRAYCEMFGYELSEIRGMSVLELHPSEYRDEVWHRISSGYGELYETVGLSKDGTTFDVEIRGKTVSRGDCILRVTAIRDITERKRAEEDLRQSELRFRSLIQNTSDIITILDADGTVRYKSPAVERILGYGEEALVGTKVFDYIHPDDLENIKRTFAEALESPGVHPPMQFRFRHANGSWRYIEAIRNNLLNDPNISGIVVNTRDITERKEAEEALRKSEASLAEAQSLAHLGNWEWDVKTGETLWSDEVFRIYGYEPKEFVPTFDQLMELVHPDDRELIRKNVDDALYESKPFEFEHRIVRPDGEERTLHCQARVYFDEYGEPSRMIGTAQDITEQKEAEEALKESEERFRTAFEDAPVGVALVGLDGRRFRVNRALCEMLGYSEEELLGKVYLEDIHPEDREISADRLRQVLEKGEGSYTLERRYVHADGRTVWKLSSVSLIQDSQGSPSHFVCLHQDITERKALEEHLEHQAFHDSLTDLPNRALFLNRLEHALARTSRKGGPVAVLLLDLNNFKVINDSLGHDAGNAVLVEVARRLRDSVRPGDTVSRLFGDEFAVLLEAPSHVKEAKRVAKRIQKRVEEPFDVEGREVFMTLSIGIAFSETVEDQPKEILRHADLAMYEAKRGGKAQHALYSPSMKTCAMERLDLENVLRRAIEREEFEVHYQPIIDLHTGDISGVEALARLRHPERGLVAASEFVQLAEETGLISPISQWVTKEACRQAKEWHEWYPERAFLISVNFSASQFSHQPDLITKILSTTGLNPQGLQLEITERTVMDDAEFSLEKLRRLKGLGVSLAIDDYGMGYSGLYYLKRMPVDYLKIDRSFISGLGEDPGDEAIVSGTIGIAHALGLKVTAEGVETADQLAKLKELGCDLAQGFHLAEPLSGEAMSALLAGESRW